MRLVRIVGIDNHSHKKTILLGALTGSLYRYVILIAGYWVHEAQVVELQGNYTRSCTLAGPDHSLYGSQPKSG